ncbi:F-box protein [Carex littledalei]|uniref:F-box protein n=1 Tax=Carex littledalei TaxID=544730 RepID=A0A833R0W4_9POAL|nr:F-box protein [Carex littledalei]
MHSKLINKSTDRAEDKALANMEIDEVSILDLPELALEIILEKLPPASLTNMAYVSTSLRERCTSNHLWERHISEKWSSILSESAMKEWELYRKNLMVSKEKNSKEKSWMVSLACAWPISWIRSLLECGCDNKPINRNLHRPEINSIMSYYSALESGKFWFPAQVFNRENGHVGFVLSCYDAHLSYNRQTNTFFARYPPHGTKPVKTEDGVQWDRVRAPLVSTSTHDLHISDCMKDLRPGDHFEIQWRKNKEFPYGWWYGVVGHFETCNETEHFCLCHEDDNVVLEFKQYSRDSRWRQTVVSRKDHREKGNETDGFYGGIRKLKTDEEIKMWRRFWPVDVLE